eukprot:3376985-Rhodomonas_salina.1
MKRARAGHGDDEGGAAPVEKRRGSRSRYPTALRPSYAISGTRIGGCCVLLCDLPTPCPIRAYEIVLSCSVPFLVLIYALCCYQAASVPRSRYGLGICDAFADKCDVCRQLCRLKS